MKLPLSVSIITLNEEKNLDRCLKSVAHLASEIVVIDSGSTDRTKEVAERYGAIFEFQKWPGHVIQKNRALSRCTQPWVLAIDADEALSEELQKSLITLFSSDDLSEDGFWINRKTFYLGDWIRHAWYPEWRLRLVRRELGQWEGVDPHDRMKEPKKTGKLSGDLLHYSYKDLEDHLSRTIKYARIGAEAKIRNGGKYQWHKLFFSPWIRFIKTLLVRQAWRDGWRGWIIAFSSMLACFAKYAFMYEQERTGGFPASKATTSLSTGRRRVTISEPFQNNTALISYIGNMENRFSTPDARFFKNDHAATVIALAIDGMQVVIKRYNKVSWIKEWRRALRKSRARKTWENAVHLRNIGISTVVPVALTEDRFGPFCFRACFISLFEEGINARNYFRDPQVPACEKQEAARNIIRTMEAIHTSGIIHGDTKDTNILIDGQRIVWLDLDAMSHHLPGFIRRIKIRKDWRLLLYNWKNYPQVQRFFISELQSHFKRAELFKILNKLIRHRKTKLGNEIDDSDRLDRNTSRNSPAAKLKLLHCAGIFTADASITNNQPDFNSPKTEKRTIEPLEIWMANSKKNDPERHRFLLTQLGEEIGYLHGCGFVHGDLRFKNLSVSKQETPPRFFFSDVAGVKHYSHFSCKHALEDLVRFNQDTCRYLNHSDRMQIFSGYLKALDSPMDLEKLMENRTGKTCRAEK